MIYKYDDIVKTTDEVIRFKNIGSSDVGKIITIYLEKEVCGGRIIDITDTGIVFNREYITRNSKRVNKRSFASIETLIENPNNKICIYEPATGDYTVYKINECTYRIPKSVKFNTDILKPGAKFYMEANGGCGIVKVLDCGEDRVLFKEEGFINGISHFNIEETPYDSAIPNPIQLKTLDELTSFDLFKRGFNGDYKLRASTIAKIKDILDEEDMSDDE